MANDPAFLFYPGDYLRDTQCLSEKAQVAYDRIMCEHMRNICITQAQLDFFTKRLSADEKQELQMILAPVKGGFHIPWVTESITKRREYSESRRKNRASTSKNKHQKISKSYDSHMENAIENVNGIINTNKSKSKLEIFEELFNDERYVEQLSMTHKGKSLNQAFEECYTHHSNAPNPPSTVGEWKQKLNTWLVNTKLNGHSKNGKQSTGDLAAALQQRIVQDAIKQQSGGSS